MSTNGTLLLRASLGAKTYRDIEIAAKASLYKLAEAIVTAFDFDFDHAFGYYSTLKGNYYDSVIKYELFADMGEAEEGVQGVKKTAVATAFAADKTKLLFLFDYGDECRFVVERLASGVKAKGAKYPRVVKSIGEAPEQYPEVED